MAKLDSDLRDNADELILRYNKSGIATSQVSDGRVFLFSIDTLLDMIDSALFKGCTSVSVLIKDAEPGLVN